MKKILIFISLMFCVCFTLNSQDIPSKESSIDSLSYRIDKLQHEYDLMLCDYELHRLDVKLIHLENNITTTINRIQINIYHSEYDSDLYEAYLDNYNAYCALFKVLQKDIMELAMFVGLKTSSSDFTEEEIEQLDVYFISFGKMIKVIESSLKIYNICIESYRRKLYTIL